MLSKCFETGCLNVRSSDSTVASEQQKCKKPRNHLKVDNLISDKCPIKIDENLKNRLATTPGPNWTSDEDDELVQLLMNSSGMGKMSNKVKNCGYEINHKEIIKELTGIAVFSI